MQQSKVVPGESPLTSYNRHDHNNAWNNKIDFQIFGRKMSDLVNQFSFDILIRIFEHLPLKDRKSARLVCRSWAGANNGTKISNREKLLCNGYSQYEMNDVLRVLMYSKRAILNLEFYYCDFRTDDGVYQFWRANGQRIEFLSLWHCQFSAIAIKHMIVECRHLRYLAMNNVLRYWAPFDNTAAFLAAFEELRLSEIRRDSLRGLRLGVRYGAIPNFIFHVLLSVYWKIEQFSFYCDNLDENFGRPDPTNQALLMSVQDFTSSAIIWKLQDFCLQMTSIEIYAGNPSPNPWTRGRNIHETILEYTFPNLKFFNTTIYFGTDDLLHELIFDFIDRHRRLQSMKFVIRDGPPNDRTIRRLMNTLLRSCLDLRDLHVEDARWYLSVDQNAVTDSEMFMRLLLSKLESLTLHLNLRIDPTLAASGLTNDRLKSLTLVKGEQYMFGLEPTLSVLLNMYRNLTRLAIMNCTNTDDNTLQTIFKYQTNLTSLELLDTSSARFTDFGFTGIDPKGQQTGWSITRLSKLQSLKLDLQYVEEITSRTISEFKFPNLMYLYILCGNPLGWDVRDGLFRMVSECTELEGLFCSLRTDVPLGDWIKLCGSLKRLRFLEYKEAHKENGGRNLRFSSLFKACPTLRVFQHSNVDRIYSYFYDILERRVKPTPGPYTMESAFPDEVPRNRLISDWIDSYWVDWLMIGAPQPRYPWSRFRE